MHLRRLLVGVCFAFLIFKWIVFQLRKREDAQLLRKMEKEIDQCRKFLQEMYANKFYGTRAENFGQSTSKQQQQFLNQEFLIDDNDNNNIQKAYNKLSKNVRNIGYLQGTQSKARQTNETYVQHANNYQNIEIQPNFIRPKQSSKKLQNNNLTSENNQTKNHIIIEQQHEDMHAQENGSQDEIEVVVDDGHLARASTQDEITDFEENTQNPKISGNKRSKKSTQKQGTKRKTQKFKRNEDEAKNDVQTPRKKKRRSYQ